MGDVNVPIGPDGRFLSRAPEDRFFEKVERSRDCWVWTAATQLGYGVFKLSPSKSVKAHRWSYEFHVGPIPPGLSLDHLCHTASPSCAGGTGCQHRRCVNPDHLEVVSIGENAMRGLGPAALNARKKTCPQGHPLVERYPGRGRDCVVCSNAYAAAYRRQRTVDLGRVPGKGGHNAAKTHCPLGHPYDESNTYWTATGRTCRACRREDNRRRKQQQRSNPQ